MNYESICRYVFSNEVVDWNLHDIKERKRQLVLARQISIYLGNWFYPKMTWRELAAIFKQDRVTAMHSKKQITNLLYSDKDLRRRVDRYLNEIRKRIDEANEVPVVKVPEPDIMDLAQMEIIAKIYADITGQVICKKQHVL